MSLCSLVCRHKTSNSKNLLKHILSHNSVNSPTELNFGVQHSLASTLFSLSLTLLRFLVGRSHSIMLALVFRCVYFCLGLRCCCCVAVNAHASSLSSCSAWAPSLCCSDYVFRMGATILVSCTFHCYCLCD